ncbi:unnamed protein product [Gordionus sp. m RMFG-2023]
MANLDNNDYKINKVDVQKKADIVENKYQRRSVNDQMAQAFISKNHNWLKNNLEGAAINQESGTKPRRLALYYDLIIQYTF